MARPYRSFNCCAKGSRPRRPTCGRLSGRGGTARPSRRHGEMPKVNGAWALKPEVAKRGTQIRAARPNGVNGGRAGRSNPCGTSVQSGHMRQCRGAAARRCPRGRHGSHDNVFPAAQRGDLDLGWRHTFDCHCSGDVAGHARGVKSWASRMKGASVSSITSRSMPMPSAAVESRAGHAPAQRHNRHRRTWPCSSIATARQTGPPLCLSARRRAIRKDHGPDACRIGRSPLQCGASRGSSRQGCRAANTA